MKKISLPSKSFQCSNLKVLIVTQKCNWTFCNNRVLCNVTEFIYLFSELFLEDSLGFSGHTITLSKHRHRLCLPFESLSFGFLVSGDLLTHSGERHACFVPSFQEKLLSFSFKCDSSCRLTVGVHYGVLLSQEGFVVVLFFNENISLCGPGWPGTM